MLKLPLLIALLAPLIAVASGDGNEPEAKKTPAEPVGPRSNFPFPLANSEPWFMKALDEVLNLDKRGAESNKKSPFGKEAIEKFLDNLFSKLRIGHPSGASTSNSYQRTNTNTTTSTTSTTTTTAAPTTGNPMRQISRGLQDIGQALGSSSVQLIERPMKVLDSLMETGANLSRVGVLGLNQAANGLASNTKPETQPAAAQKPKQRVRDQPDDESQYYEFAGPDEPWAYRRPKYFSRECPFRFACEVGKLVKPYTYPVSKAFETNRFIQDLHNRYTRAMTYGTIRGDCERYYCVLVKMLGGPVGFASGVAEIVNRIINSDLYNDYEFQRVPSALAIPFAQAR